MKNRVLVIEDCKMMLSFVSQLLKKNYEVTSCESAETALTWLDSHEIPDLILLDHNLPDMDGLQFIHQVRQKSDLEETPIIMLSAVKDSANRLRVLEAGANDYVTKPFHPRELELRVEQNIENARLKSMSNKDKATPAPAKAEATNAVEATAEESKKNTSFLQRFRSAFAP